MICVVRVCESLTQIIAPGLTGSRSPGLLEFAVGLRVAGFVAAIVAFHLTRKRGPASRDKPRRPHSPLGPASPAGRCRRSMAGSALVGGYSDSESCNVSLSLCQGLFLSPSLSLPLHLARSDTAEVNSALTAHTLRGDGRLGMSFPLSEPACSCSRLNTVYSVGRLGTRWLLVGFSARYFKEVLLLGSPGPPSCTPPQRDTQPWKGRVMSSTAERSCQSH